MQIVNPVRVYDMMGQLFFDDVDDMAHEVAFRVTPGIPVARTILTDDNEVVVEFPDAYPSDATLAHELGHAYACWKHPKASHACEYNRHEAVAFYCEACYKLGHEADRDIIEALVVGRTGAPDVGS